MTTIKTKKNEVEEPEPAEETGTHLYYEINTGGGDLYLTINAGRKSTIDVMSGEPSQPPKPPKP
jgi:hypothetical protein